MTRRALAILAAVLAALLAATAATRLLSKPPAAARLAPEDLPRRATRLELEGPAGRFTFSRSTGPWRMESPADYPADAALAEALKRLPAATLTEPLSEDAARHPLFGLAASSATRVRVRAGGSTPEVDFWVGKDGPDFDTFFLRREGAPSVYMAQGMAGSAWTKGAGEWLSKSVCDLPKASIEALSARASTATVRLSRAEGAWRPAGSKTVLSSATVAGAVEPALVALAPLEAWRVLPAREAPPRAKTGLDKPELVIEAARAGGGKVVLRVGGKDPDGYRYLEKEGEKRVLFLVSDWKLDPFRKKEFVRIK